MTCFISSLKALLPEVDGHWRRCKKVVQAQPQSVKCVPLLHQGTAEEWAAKKGHPEVAAMIKGPRVTEPGPGQSPVRPTW